MSIPVVYTAETRNRTEHTNSAYTTIQNTLTPLPVHYAAKNTAFTHFSRERGHSAVLVGLGFALADVFAALQGHQD
jgi:hypothetical protein